MVATCNAVLLLARLLRRTSTARPETHRAMSVTDFALVLAGAGILTLVASTVLMSVTLPTMAWKGRHQRARPKRAGPVLSIQATHRPLIASGPAGRPLPAALPPALDLVSPIHTFGRPHRQMMFLQDVHGRAEEVAEAVETIERLLDTDPHLLARLMMDWIQEPATPDSIGDTI